MFFSFEEMKVLIYEIIRHYGVSIIIIFHYYVAIVGTAQLARKAAATICKLIVKSGFD